jgi:hypothetical protein
MSAGFRQNHSDLGYFINVATLVNKVSGLVGTSSTLSTVTWCQAPLVSSISTLATGGLVLRDAGKTLVSSNRTFRKVQVQVANFSSTNGVGGASGTTLNEDYLTGYIELGFEGNGQGAPVARFGR